MSDRSKTFLNSIAGKLAILAGGSIAVSGANAATTATTRDLGLKAQTSEVSTTPANSAKLVLKQQSTGLTLIAEHSSHSSHASHSSHSSHSSSSF